MKVMIFLDYFTPAYRAGGPIRIFEAVARSITKNDEALIVTQDHDWGEKRPFDSVQMDHWVKYENASVFYASKFNRSSKSIKAMIEHSSPDAIHLNSLFSRVWTIKILLLRRFRGIKGIRFFISPHGELATAALGHKRYRKKAFLLFAKTFDLFGGIHWIATSDKEAAEIKRAIGPRTKTLVIPPPFPATTPHATYTKRKGELKLIFFARISAMKNIGYLNRILPKVKGRVTFDVYGPIDKEYEESWYNIFMRLRKECPGAVNYRGPVPSTEAAQTLAAYDLFIQPSLTENFGYSIIESLAAGTPVIISDRTPWNEIKVARAGNTLNLEHIDSWIEKLQLFIDMDHEEWKQWSERATSWAAKQNTSAKEMFKVYAGASLLGVGSVGGQKPPTPEGAKIATGK